MSFEYMVVYLMGATECAKGLAQSELNQLKVVAIRQYLTEKVEN